ADVLASAAAHPPLCTPVDRCPARRPPGTARLIATARVSKFPISNFQGSEEADRGGSKQTSVFCRLSSGWRTGSLTDHGRRWSVPLLTAPEAQFAPLTQKSPVFTFSATAFCRDGADV